MMSVHDALGNYLEVSPECKDVTGWSQEALLGCSSADFVHDDDMPVVEEAYARAVEERRPMYLVCRIEGRDGWIWVASRFHPEEDDHGMYLVAATQAVSAPDDKKAWYRPADATNEARENDVAPDSPQSR